MNRIIELTIKEIKGISNKTIKLDITPNKPTILVAPNGYGKSSIAAAFNSTYGSGTTKKIVVQKEDVHNGGNINDQRFEISLKKNNKVEVYVADSTRNQLYKELGIFVIKSNLKAKGIGSQFGKATGRLIIEDIVICKIPNKVKVDSSLYKPKQSKKIKQIVKDYESLKIIIDNINHFKTTGIFNKINKTVNNKQKPSKLILQNKSILTQVKEQLTLSTDELLYELIEFVCYNIKYIQDRFDTEEFKTRKKALDDLIRALNTSSSKICIKETKGLLTISFPDANHLSNGQRDILTFASNILKAEYSLNERYNILIIDEIFDYLDHANLISLQYYIIKLIESFQKKDKFIYPILLTHLDPVHFDTFAFKKKKVVYLECGSKKNEVNLKKLIEKRSNKQVHDDFKDLLSKFYLHYHAETHKNNNSHDFQNNNLPIDWGIDDKFYQNIDDKLSKYIYNNEIYPLSISCALRIRIEKYIYDQLGDKNKTEFIETHETKKKIQFAMEKGVEVPETFILLGLIYNEGAHINRTDPSQNLTNKLNNDIIRKMIKEVFETTKTQTYTSHPQPSAQIS